MRKEKVINFFRVDHRLLHGQVAQAWYGATGANCILIANDEVAGDQLRKNVMKLAKPAGAKLVIQSIAKSANSINSGVTDKYHVFVVVASIHDAYRLLQKLTIKINELNLGGTSPSAEAESLSAAVGVTPQDRKDLRKLQEKGMEIFIQQVPSEAKKVVNFRKE